MLDYARLQKKSIIFVTDDGKKDWWLPESKSRGQRRPLPELVQEMYIEAAVLLHMYEGYEFLKQAELFLKLDERPDVIEEAKEVTQKNTIESNQERKVFTGHSWEYQEGIAVLEWLRSEYPSLETTVWQGGAPNILITEPNGKRTGVEVNFRLDPFTLNDVTDLFRLVRHPGRGIPVDMYMLVLVLDNKDTSVKLARDIREGLNIPAKIFVVIGYLTVDGQFTAVSTLPQNLLSKV